MNSIHKIAQAKSATSQTWFVGRHQGSIDWIRHQAIPIDQFCEHLDENNPPSAGDTVIGTLPVHVIAKLNLSGVRFMHLELDLPNHLRGKELGRSIIEQSNPKLQEYIVWRVAQKG